MKPYSQLMNISQEYYCFAYASQWKKKNTFPDFKDMVQGNKTLASKTDGVARLRVWPPYSDYSY